MDIIKQIRRATNEVRIGAITIGGSNPIAIQSMTNTDTNDVDACVDQIESIDRAGGKIVRLTAQGRREGESLKYIVAKVREDGYHTAIVADIHFVPEVAAIAAQYVDKVRVNPGNYRVSNGEFEALIEQCRQRGVAIRIGVNHGSLAQRIVDAWGDTPEGMVVAAMEFLRRCKDCDFDQVVVSMKSSNSRVMVFAYRLLVVAMESENMHYPIHLGVTEAGNGLEARVKSAIGIGALLTDGIGDTVRVSLTESPINEPAVARVLIDHFESRYRAFDAEGIGSEVEDIAFEVSGNPMKLPVEYNRRSNFAMPIVHSELTSEFKVVEAVTNNPTAELRAAILELNSKDPIVVRRKYNELSKEHLAIKAAADLGSLFLDGLADGIWIEADGFSKEEIEEIELMILQGSRVRISQTEYIACPGCGRTLYDIEKSLNEIKSRTSHLKNLKIGVMGCIVNGPGEMADADYGYVGSAAGKITLYKGREIIKKDIPQSQALDNLIELIKNNGDWQEP